MSDDEKDSKSEHDEETFVEASPVKKVKKLDKKPPTPVKGRVSKPVRQRTVSARTKTRQAATTTTRDQHQHQHQQPRSNDSFYQGALLGSFLGATLSTVITNAVSKLIG